MTMKNMSDQPTYGRVSSRVSRIVFKIWTLIATVLLLRMSFNNNNALVTRAEVQTNALLEQKLEELFQRRVAEGGLKLSGGNDSATDKSESTLQSNNPLKWDALLQSKDNIQQLPPILQQPNTQNQVQKSGMAGNKAFEAESQNSKIDFEYLTKIKQEAKTRYYERNRHIKSYCDKNLNYNPLFKKANTKFNYWEKQMWFSKQYKFAWCPVPKAGSTTWTEHMSILTGKRWQDIMEELTEEGVPRVDHRNVFKAKYYGLPTGSKVEEFANKDVFTWVFVRHPFSRIVSAYSEKMDKDWIHTENKAMKDVRDLILTKYRNMPITE